MVPKNSDQGTYGEGCHISQLRKYDMALYNNYGEGWEEEWIVVKERIMSNVGHDLVDCT